MQSRKPRFQALLSASVTVDARAFECTVSDLSRSGALLAGDFPLPSAGTVMVSVRMAMDDLQIEIPGQIMRVETAPDAGGQRVGIAFPPLDEEPKRILDALIARLTEGLVPAALAALPRGAHGAPVRAALEATPLTHRIALAKRAAVPERRLLFQDKNPQVLEALARNPMILSEELKRLARRPDFPPAAIAVVANDPRWERDEEVQAIVAAHARAPLAAALKAVDRLGPRGIDQALRRSGLQPAVRARLLARRS